MFDDGTWRQRDGTGVAHDRPFSWLSPVFFDELDLNGALHNARFAVHVERAQSALFEQLGKGWASWPTATRTCATWSVSCTSSSWRRWSHRARCWSS